MAGFTNLAEVAVLDHVFDKAALTPPQFFVALSTTPPTEAGGNFTEPSGGSYARVSTLPADWSTATAGDPTELSNAVDIAFPTATGSWGTVEWFGLFTALTGGDLWVYGPLTTSKTIDNGDEPTFAIGTLRARIGGVSDF